MAKQFFIESIASDQHTARLVPGAYIRTLREERRIRPIDIERKSRVVAESKGNQEFFISHSALASMENGSIPGIHKIFSLAVCLDVSIDGILHIFGMNAPEVDKFRLAHDGDSKAVGPVLVGPSRGAVLTDEGCSANSTRLLHQDPNIVPSQIAVWFKRPDPKHYRYAIMGLDDTSMREIVPAGSLIEIDPRQKAINMSEWDALQMRPVYLLWHENGYSCGWCQIDDNKLLLLPHPAASQHKVRLFRIPREASVIGRVTCVWPPVICGALRPVASAPLLTGTAE
jgi:transcriptional regulator with XRE-family HTH domain